MLKSRNAGSQLRAHRPNLQAAQFGRDVWLRAQNRCADAYSLPPDRLRNLRAGCSLTHG
jgi:hypothetical protein